MEMTVTKQKENCHNHDIIKEFQSAGVVIYPDNRRKVKGNTMKRFIIIAILFIFILFDTSLADTSTPTPTMNPTSTSIPLQLIDEFLIEKRSLIDDYLVNPSEQFVINELSKLKVITEIQAATEDHDPNGNLHKQGGYTAAIFFTTTYLNPSTVFGYSIIDKGTDAGGQIEVYETVDSAKRRDDYLSSFSGFINPGSHKVLGSMVIRTSKKLTSTQQKELEGAIINQFIRSMPASTLVPSITPTPTLTYTPTLTPTLIPTLTPTNTPIPTTEPDVTLTPVYGIANIQGDTGIVVREKPSENSNIIRTIPNNSNVEVTGHIALTNGHYWISIQTDQGWNGWVRLNDLILPTPIPETYEPTDAINNAYQTLYDQAVALMQSQDFDTSKMIFEKISDFADSAEMIKECDYQLALSFEKNGAFVDAMVAFTILGDYKDSNDHVLQNALKIQQTQNDR